MYMFKSLPNSCGSDTVKRDPCQQANRQRRREIKHGHSGCSSTHLVWHILSELVGRVLGPLVSSLSFSPFRLLLRLLWHTLVLSRSGLFLRSSLASDRFLSSRDIRWWFRAKE